MNANDSQDLKLKLAKEFKQLNSFIDRYAFYEQHKRELNYEDPQDPLMIEFNQCNEELRKFEISELLKKQNEELGIYKPEPSSDDEGKQMIEYWVKQFEPSPSFEELCSDFEKNTHGKNNKKGYIKFYLEGIGESLEKDNADMVSLLDDVIDNYYKIDFSLLYQKANRAQKKKNPYYPLSINYQKLASAISLVQFRIFLKNYPLDKVKNTQHLNERVSTEPKEKTALSPSSDISTDVDKKEGGRTKDPYNAKVKAKFLAIVIDEGKTKNIPTVTKIYRNNDEKFADYAKVLEAEFGLVVKAGTLENNWNKPLNDDEKRQLRELFIAQNLRHLAVKMATQQ